MIIQSPYLKPVYNPKKFKQLVSRTAKRVKKLSSELNFDAIAFRGSSGAAMAFPLSMLTNISLVHVRKDKSHGCPVEGNCGVKRYLIIDDFIDSGRTMKKINTQIREFTNEAVCVGILLYLPGNMRIPRKTSDFKFNSRLTVPLYYM